MRHFLQVLRRRIFGPPKNKWKFSTPEGGPLRRGEILRTKPTPKYSTLDDSEQFIPFGGVAGDTLQEPDASNWGWNEFGKRTNR